LISSFFIGPISNVKFQSSNVKPMTNVSMTKLFEHFDFGLPLNFEL